MGGWAIARRNYWPACFAVIGVLWVAMASMSVHAQDGVRSKKSRKSVSIEALSTAHTIARDCSASRDASVLTMNIFARSFMKGGGEFALLTLTVPSETFRTGYAGFIELLFNAETDGVNRGPMPAADGQMLWRGAYLFYASLALDALAAELCGTFDIETTILYRHESEHYTGSNYGGEGLDVVLTPYVGDNFALEAAVA